MTKYGTAALALAGVLALSATSASAQWRGHRHHGHWGTGAGIAAGVAAGALIGSAVAARPYYGPGPGYYDDGYYYDAPVAARPYGYSYGYPNYQGWSNDCGGSYGQDRDCSAGATSR